MPPDNSKIQRGDDGTFVRFFSDPTIDGKATKEAGRPKYMDKEYLEITIPGDQYSRPIFRASPEYIERYQTQYDNWKAGKDQEITGIPLEHYQHLNERQKMELKALDINSVEALAGLHDGIIQDLGIGGRAMVEKAQSYLEVTKNNVNVASIMDRVEQQEELLDQNLAYMKRQDKELETMRNAMASMEALRIWS